MKPIKFRGESFAGKIVYGDLVQLDSKMAIITTNIDDVICDCRKNKIPKGLVGVKPETVAQLVGYDADGKEVYEGDTLIGYWEPYIDCSPEEIVEREYTIKNITHITDIITNGGGYRLDRPSASRTFRLKK